MTSVSTDRRFGINSGAAVKVPCRCATTTAITLNGLQTIDGITVAADDRVLVKNQASSIANGIYSASTGNWFRAPDFDGKFDVKSGSLVIVNFGSANAGSMWRITSADPLTVGTSSLSFGLVVVNALSSLNFQQAGTGAVLRNAQDKMRDTISVKDFGAVGDGVTNDATAIANAITAAAGGGVLFPNGSYVGALPATYTAVLDYSGPNTPINLFQESGETTPFSKRVLRSQLPGSHSGNLYSVSHIEGRPIGSGANGPSNADYGMTLSLLKQSFASTSVVGEMDGMYIVIRQGGTLSDTAAWLADVAHYGTGFAATLEATTSIIAANVVTRQVRIQAGICDNVNAQYIGYYTKTEVGATNGDAYRADTSGTSVWTYLFNGLKSGVQKFSITGDGAINLIDASSQKKTLRCNGNAFSVLDNAGSTEIFVLDNVGALSIGSFYNGSAFKSAGTQVVGARVTGWAAATNTKSKATFDTTTVTTAQLAARVGQLIDDLMTHGLIGA